MKRGRKGGKQGRQAKRQKNDNYGYAVDFSESEDEPKELTEAEVAALIAKQYKALIELPNYFRTLHPDTRSGLKAVYETEEFPTPGEFMRELNAAKKIYDTKKAWDAAGAKLGKTKYLAGGIADGELVVLFMSIGNGDCIFVRTPGGNVIVIDAGSRKRPTGNYRKRIGDVLKTHFLKTATKQAQKPELYAVILTHADQDHYNELAPLLDPQIRAIRHLFHSDELTAYTINPTKWKPTDPAATRKTVVPNKSVTENFLRTKSIFRSKVSINSAEVALPKSGSTDATPYVVDAAKKTIQILDENWKGVKTEIYLLAGGITDRTETNRTVMAEDTRPGRPKGVKRDRYAKPLQARGTGEENNAASVVTLIKSRGKTFLLCGDATYLTEVFLVNKHATTITNVDVAQVEHHGSGTAHAGGVYVETINPLFAVASSGTHEGDENPRWRAIAKYLGYKKLKPGKKQQTRPVRLRTDMDEHLVEAYDEDKNLVDYKLWEPHKKKAFYSTRSNGDVCFIVNTKNELLLGNKKTTG